MPTSGTRKGGIYHREAPRTPAVSINGSSQTQSWVGTEMWAQPRSAPMLGSKKVAFVQEQGYQDAEVAFAISTDEVFPRVPSAIGSLASSSSHTFLDSSTRTSSATAVSGQSSFFQSEAGSGAGGSTGKDETKKEKRKLQTLYKRASRSTRAFAKWFGRSSTTPKGSPSNGGVKKRSSLKPPPLPILPAGKAKNRHSRDQPALATGSSFGFSMPIPVSPPLSVHRGKEHSPKTASTNVPPRGPMSINVRASLHRSSSVSSPLGVPTSPSSSRNRWIGQGWGIRGRDSPFPLNNSSSVSLPLMPERERERTVSQGSVSSGGKRNQARPPMPRPPTPSHGSRSGRQTPQQTYESASTQTPEITRMPTFIRRPRSKSVYETQRPRNVDGNLSTEAVPPQQQSRQRQNKISGRTDSSATTTAAILLDRRRDQDNLPLGGVLVARAKNGSHKINKDGSMEVTMPATTGLTFRGSEGMVSDAGDETAQENRRLFQRKHSENGSKSSLPVPLPPSVIEGLSERHTQSRAASRKSSLESSPAPSRPQTPRQRPAPLDSRSVVRQAPSLTSLRTKLRPPPTPRAASHYEESKQRFGTVQNMHVRSPSAPTTFWETKIAPEPLPSSVTEGLRTRSRSFSRSREPPPVMPSLVPSEMRKPLSSAYAPVNLPPPPSGNNSLDSQTPPSLNTALPMRSRTIKHTAPTKSPSMPELYAATHSKYQHGGSRATPNGEAPSRRPSSPPPPIPQLNTTTKTSLAPMAIPKQVNPNIILPRSDSAPQFAPHGNVLRPKSNLTRRTEFSYPSTKFQVQSGSSLVVSERRGGVGPSDAPTWPARYPNVQTPISRGEDLSSNSRSHSRSRSHSHSQPQPVTYDMERLPPGVPRHEWGQTAVIGAAF